MDRSTTEKATHVKSHVQAAMGMVFMRALECEARSLGFESFLSLTASGREACKLVLAMWRPNKKNESKGLLLSTAPEGEKMVVLRAAEAEEAANGGSWCVEGEDATDWQHVYGKGWRDKLRRLLLLS